MYFNLDDEICKLSDNDGSPAIPTVKQVQKNIMDAGIDRVWRPLNKALAGRDRIPIPGWEWDDIERDIKSIRITNKSRSGGDGLSQ